MADAGDRRTWFGLGGRSRLPRYLRKAGGAPQRVIKRAIKRPARQTSMQKRIELQARRGKRLKGLDEFEKPDFVGRMAWVARRRRLAWWAMVAAAFVVGGAIGWWLI